MGQESEISLDTVRKCKVIVGYRHEQLAYTVLQMEMDPILIAQRYPASCFSDKRGVRLTQ